jgi:hypothetical protein
VRRATGARRAQWCQLHRQWSARRLTRSRGASGLRRRGPLGDGATFDASLPEEAAELPLPPFEVLEQGSSLVGLSDAQREEFRRRAVPEPGRVVREPLHLSNPERRRAPTTIIACSIPSEQIRSLAAADHPMFAEVATLTDLQFMDLPTGHWPMWSRPGDLAELIWRAVTRSGA